MIVLLDDRWSYFGAVAQITPDGPKCPHDRTSGFPVPFLPGIAEICTDSCNGTGYPAHFGILREEFHRRRRPHSPARAAPQWTEKMSRKCPAVHKCPDIRRGRYPPPESGRVLRRSPRPDRTEPGRRPLRRRSTAHPTGVPARAVWRLSHGRAGPCSRESGGRSSSRQALPPASPPVMHSGLEPLLRQKPPSWSNS